jgi:fructokinase
MQPSSDALLVGEALWDLLDRPDERCFLQAPGGSVLNVAVGLARLGHGVEFAGALADDVLADRLAAFLAGEGVRTSTCPRVPGQSTLAVTTFAGPEPSFAFYGHPPAYLLLDASPEITAAAATAGVVHTGSIGLLSASVRRAALAAFDATTGWRTLDPNVRPRLVDDVADYRRHIDDLAARAHLVKLSVVDAQVLYPQVVSSVSPSAAELTAVARHLLGRGARAVLVTLGAAGARLVTDGVALRVPSRARVVVDATGAGDAVMVGALSHLLRHGWPSDVAAWAQLLTGAMDVAATVCARPGAAEAMPVRPDSAHARDEPVEDLLQHRA